MTKELYLFIALAKKYAAYISKNFPIGEWVIIRERDYKLEYNNEIKAYVSEDDNGFWVINFSYDIEINSIYKASRIPWDAEKNMVQTSREDAERLFKTIENQFNNSENKA